MRLNHWNLSAATLGLVGAVILFCGVWVAPVHAEPVDEIRAKFDQAMGHALAERVPKLEQLDKAIGRRLFEEGLSGEAKAKALYYRYHIQRQLAKYPEACETYAEHLEAWRGAGMVGRAHAVFLRDLDRWKQKRSYGHMAAICRQVEKTLAADEKIKMTAIYHLANANYRMPGMLERAVPLCEKIIRNHPDSEWRPKAMRMLANAQMGLGKYKAALGTLELLEQQYPDTKFEHYADMRPAAIWEMRGEPQKALAIYQASLDHHPDQIYWDHIHRHIERLQGVIEKQLIQDALEGLGKKDKQPDTPGVADQAVGRVEDEPGEDSLTPVTQTPPEPRETGPVASTR